MKIKRIMIAAPKSGSGKTGVTCALLKNLKNKGIKTVSFKCGPDYIDPLFHKNGLGIPSYNLDTYFTDPDTTKKLFARDAEGFDFAVFEGVMGLFDGVGGVKEEGSSYHLAKVTKTPIVLVPVVSISFANLSPSEVAISLFAAITHKIIVKGSSAYLLAISFVICSIFFG